MERVRWGILSTANINKALIPAIRTARRGALRAVASREPDRGAAYATEWDIQRAYGSYQALLDAGTVDAVYISLPNHMHAEWTVKALDAGMHVLCEKPFALTVEDVDAVIEAAERNGRVAAEAFMYRHHPQTKLVGEWVREGRLGKVTMVRGTFDFAIHDRNNIRFEAAYGGGCLWDVGIYPVSFAQYVMGAAPDVVLGQSWSGNTGVDETFVGQLRYPGKRFAQIASSFRTPWHTMAEVVGTEGRLHLNRPFVKLDRHRRLVLHPKDGEPRELTVPDEELYAGELRDMHAQILDGAPPCVPLSESRDHVRTAVALYESASRREVVRLEG